VVTIVSAAICDLSRRGTSYSVCERKKRPRATYIKVTEQYVVHLTVSLFLCRRDFKEDVFAYIAFHRIAVHLFLRYISASVNKHEYEASVVPYVFSAYTCLSSYRHRPFVITKPVHMLYKAHYTYRQSNLKFECPSR